MRAQGEDEDAVDDTTEGEEEFKIAEPREPKYIVGLFCV